MAQYDDYENVKSRKLRFYEKHPDGRIVAELLNDDIDDKALFKATVYLTADEQAKGLARAVGFALEIRDKTKPLNKYGKEYESVNFTSWTENCEESAVGRALDNAGFMSAPKCSREEMEKVSRHASHFSGPANTHVISNVTNVTHVGEEKNSNICCGTRMLQSRYNANEVYCPKCKRKQAA